MVIRVGQEKQMKSNCYDYYYSILVCHLVLVLDFYERLNFFLYTPYNLYVCGKDNL